MGQTVAARFQTPTLFKIAADLNSMQIEALVSEADIGSKRAESKIFVDAFFEEEFEGVLKLYGWTQSRAKHRKLYCGDKC